MAGHSKYKNIMYRKGAQDKKRSALFSKLSREITVAAKMGLPDPDANARLRAAIIAARAQSMPKDNIQRSIDKASGGDAENYEEIRYEGFGPGGVALIVEALTDNRNRTATNVRTIFSKNGGNLGASGSVSHGFERLGLIEYPASAGDAEKVLEAAIEAGAEDVESRRGRPPHLDQRRKPARSRASARADARRGRRRQARLEARDRSRGARRRRGSSLMKLIDALEEDDDVQTVWGNYDVPDEELEKLALRGLSASIPASAPPAGDLIEAEGNRFATSPTGKSRPIR